MSGRREASLRRRVIALGVLALATVVGSLVMAVWLLRQTESARISEADLRLDAAVEQLGARYEYLRGSYLQAGTRGPLVTEDGPALRALTESVLTGFAGVEGGFWSKPGQKLIGYAYPTYGGTGPKTDVPAAEQPRIEQLVRRAVESRGAARQKIDAGPDTILFRAQPILYGGEPIGAVWLMRRLATVRDPQRKLALAALLALTAAVALSSALAFLLARRIDAGISSIETALIGLEARLDVQVPPLRLAELDRIGQAVGRLAQKLADNEARRSTLEESVRRNDRLASLGALVAGVAHEVKNPLASIQLKLHLARARLTQGRDLADTFEVLEEETARLDRLVQRLLLLARPLHSRAEISLRELVEERLALHRELGATLSLDEGDVRVTVERDLLGQIIDNLVINAIEARATAVRISLTVEGGRATLSVCDDGPGIAEEARARLFEPFFTTRARGTGLGLFISAELARRMGGELRCPSARSGACFEVILPC
jgi:signal transduction histidine kinase